MSQITDRSSSFKKSRAFVLPSPVRMHESHPIALPPCFSPGPGNYTLLGQFDDEFRFAHSGLRKGFSISGHGTTRMLLQGCDSPGPKYDIRERILQRGYKFTTSTRFAARRPEAGTPSPATYCPAYTASSWFSTQPRVVFRPKDMLHISRRPSGTIAQVKPRGWEWKQHQLSKTHVQEEDAILGENRLKKMAPRVYGGKHDPTQRSTFGGRMEARVEDVPGPGSYEIRGPRPSSKKYCVMSGTGHHSFVDERPVHQSHDEEGKPSLYFPAIEFVRPRSSCGILYLTS